MMGDPEAGGDLQTWFLPWRGHFENLSPGNLNQEDEPPQYLDLKPAELCL